MILLIYFTNLNSFLGPSRDKIDIHWMIERGHANHKVTLDGI